MWLGPIYCRSIMTVTFVVDNWVCLMSVITNTADYILYGKKAVFFLRIVQCTIHNVTQMETCRMFGIHSYHCTLYSQCFLPRLTDSSQFTTTVIPWIRAMSLAVWPLLFFSLTSAPLSTSSFATYKCPLCTASCSGVSFNQSTGSTFAPQSNNRRHTSKCPWEAAIYKAVRW